ncbi:LYR motif-containing protein 4 isoform X1 [Herpailurus yagouaroundi]|uniref:LYR motif-containing protein 4 isoform X1 n=1 Tax=Herpailurus yagouaroundi TaxID=1608482 RepID=UPI001AD67BE7|nr:LYR motif-containing protein 4 isoform X1 [Puma yagouaroundi]
MAASSRAQVLDLYRAMLRESKHFSAYNYRTYAVRRIRDAFRENKNVKDPVEIQTLVNKAKRDLEIIRRQKFSCCLKSIGLHTAKSTLANCIRPTSLLLKIKRNPGPREPGPATTGSCGPHLQHPFCAWDAGSQQTTSGLFLTSA